MELQVPLLQPVDAEKAESFISEKKIGERIKRLRLKRSMGLVELGRQTGLSASFLSQLETGRVVPTLRNLARIAAVFNKDLSYFFEAEAVAVFRIQRKRERTRLPQSGVEIPTYYFESLGFPMPDRSLDPYLAEFLPLKKNMEVRSHVHAGFEFLYVLNGQLEIHHGNQKHLLDTGDAVSFDATAAHSYRCAGETPTTVIIVTMHQGQHLGHSLGSQGPARGRGQAGVTTMPTQGQDYLYVDAENKKTRAPENTPLMMKPARARNAASSGSAGATTRSSAR